MPRRDHFARNGSISLAPTSDMPLLTASIFLQANLESLGKRNADLAAKLAGVEPAATFSLGESADGVPSASLGGRQLCSKVHPLEEAGRLVDGIDLVEHAVVAIIGFGMGWHVRRLAARADKSALLVVYEPDLSLLRAVFEQVDHSSWLGEAVLLFVTDADDRGSLSGKLNGAEAILGQGVHILEHPPSRERLGEHAMRFARALNEHVAAARTTLATTLMRSVDTISNLLRNIDHYAAGNGVGELEGAAAGCPAVVVSAGPSLHRNMRLLAQRGVRDRCVIIAVQTALRPLLQAGIRPHFVTALDYHEISRRFYEDIDPALLQDVTLVVDPKVHPVVIDAFPGAVRCCSNGFLDKALADAARPMGDLPAGATVAHLAMYLARHLGCDPVAMIGQDLGFPDGLYYAPGAAIHDSWAPELNPFNTIAMMEWQRIARHRLHLRKTQDVNGRSIFTDAQMHTYLQQFERDFAEYAAKGLTTIDASEGGVRKQHTRTLPLRDFLQTHARQPLPPLPAAGRVLNAERLRLARSRIEILRGDVERMREVSRDTQSILERMLVEQTDARRMAKHFERIEANRQEVERLFLAFELLNQMNQMGVFRRMKADRRLQLAQGLDPLTVQKRQLERDLENVRWLADAATELLSQLDAAQRSLDESSSTTAPSDPPAAQGTRAVSRTVESSSENRVAALIPIDPARSGCGITRSLAAEFKGRRVLQCTLERLGESTTLDSIVLIAPLDFDVDSLLDRSRINLPVKIERCDGESPFGPEQEAIAAARLFADTCWRGGIAGASIYDEVLCPQTMSAVMMRLDLTAALVCAPDWPLINVIGEGGCDAVVRRHLERPQQHRLVFTQSPPGLCGCVINASLMQELSQRNRLSTVGGLLVYQPHAPQHDPIARDACVQTPHAMRASLARSTFDSQRWRAWINGEDPVPTPQHLVLELTTHRCSSGVFAHSLGPCRTPRSPIDVGLARDIIEQLTATGADDLVLTLHGHGDSLLHPHFDDVIRAAKTSGFRAVNFRTELFCDHSMIDRLLASGVDVVSVDVNADRAVTYQAMMGVERFRDVLLNLEYLIEHRRRFTSQTGSSAMALPWVVPHLQRRAETYEDIDTFFDRWQHMLGTVVIDDPPVTDPRPIGITPAVTPPRVAQREAMRRMTILCDGTVPLSDGDVTGDESIGIAASGNVLELWRILQERRSGVAAKEQDS